MTLFKLLSPQSWIGKIALWGMFFFAGFSASEYLQEPCETTKVEINQKNKAKRNSTVESGLEAVLNTDTQSCDEWLRGLTNKEIRTIRKSK